VKYSCALRALTKRPGTVPILRSSAEQNGTAPFSEDVLLLTLIQILTIAQNESLELC
jgi:hypothetical protein